MQDLFANPLYLLLPFGLIFYFLVMRPQQQQQAQLRSALDSVRRGDMVVTSGGILGKVVKAPAKEDTEITLEIADGVQVKVVKDTLVGVRAKTQPVDKSDKS